MFPKNEGGKKLTDDRDLEQYGIFRLAGEACGIGLRAVCFSETIEFTHLAKRWEGWYDGRHGGFPNPSGRRRPSGAKALNWHPRDVAVSAKLSGGDATREPSELLQVQLRRLVVRDRLLAVDIRLEIVVLKRELVELGFHHVADRDDAHQFAVFQNRQMPDPPVGHQPHHDRYFVVVRAGRYLGGHVVGNRVGPEPRLGRIARAEDVALGDDAQQLVSTAHEQRTAIVLDQRRDRGGQ